MAVKKSETKKTSTSPKAGTVAKAAPKKAAPKKAAPKKSTMPAEAKSKPAPAPAPASAKKVAVKKAPAVKLTDAQGRVLSAVLGAKDAGYVGTKAEGQILEALLKKKLIKKGKKEAERLLPIPGDQGRREARPGPGPGLGHVHGAHTGPGPRPRAGFLRYAFGIGLKTVFATPCPETTLRPASVVIPDRSEGCRLGSREPSPLCSLAGRRFAGESRDPIPPVKLATRMT